MSKKQDAKEIESLRDEIRHHEYAYYVLDDPEISDAAFDRLMNHLKRTRGSSIPICHRRFAHAARRRRAPRRLSEVRHQTPMVSLDNAFSSRRSAISIAACTKLTGREKVDYVAEHKFDGLSLSLHLRKWHRSCAASRAATAPPAKTSRRT